ncbi:2-polyprenyl-6-methoxyphenol hydroxylase-like oxidoreductase [Pseudomonas sp. GM102]|uniref:FAD-dependent oxidoreductase n=1 Tax=Pseudomonas sp. GM102 TaxID=1144321 RepID=UPI00026FB4D4|nr:FAD-dependent oxidoreductase [Pseudomonas sp. GM102]EJL99679.1 2-polyprenyl-6-methoxyphenol hydroxylase-like oxidoreductase [Pseudomonas sp. GM102]
MNRSDVLIIGAGPTGLVLALWLSKLGIRVRIIDKTSTPGTTSRALAVQARTLELYSQLDLSDAVVQNGHKVAAANFWVKGEPVARLPLSTIGEGLTPYAFLEIYPQDEHERLLIERLEAFGITVERDTELQSFEETGDGITARLRLPDGQQETCQACYLAGCDGARSIVRKTLDTGFPGGTYQQIFYVADVQARGPTFNGELHVDLDEADFLAVFPLSDEGRARLIGTVRDERADRAETLQFEDVSSRAIEHLKVQIDQVNWFSTYRVHHRVADHFRTGRAFLLGDAAHVHSPAGGQGMNTGIGDAINLAWKLATVLSGGATTKLLDSYETERIAFARRLVATTDRVFSFVTSDGPIADLVRIRVAPFLIPKMISFEAAREFLFRTVSQTTLNYRGMPLSEGVAGHVHGGDRLPWAHDGEGDNFESLKDPSWQVHVYGDTSDEMIAWCTEHHLPLQVFDWRPAFETVGLARNGFYLLRPDTYVAIADYSADPKVIERYFRDRGIRPFFG